MINYWQVQPHHWKATCEKCCRAIEDNCADGDVFLERVVQAGWWIGEDPIFNNGEQLFCWQCFRDMWEQHIGEEVSEYLDDYVVALEKKLGLKVAKLKLVKEGDQVSVLLVAQ